MECRETRNSSLELTRLIGCIMVIALHVRPNWATDKGFNNLNFILWALVRDGVTLFWLIQGYFLINGKKYGQVLKRTIIQIMIPAVIMMLFNAVFADYILKGNIPRIHFIDLKESFKSVYAALVSWNATLIPCCPHLWYVFSYFIVILWLPILYLLAENVFARRWAMGLAVVGMAINDIQAFHSGAWGNIIPLTILSENTFFVLLGYEIRLYKDKKATYKMGGALMFMIANVIKYCLQKIIFHISGSYDNIYFMNNTGTLVGIMSAMGLFIWLSSIQIKSVRWGNIWRFFARYTYYIYLVHWLIVQKLSSGKFYIWLYQKTKDLPAGGIIYMLIFTFAVLGISFLISFAVKTVFDLILKDWKIWRDKLWKKRLPF